MNPLLILLAVPFVWGLKRGSSVCLFVCGSALAPMTISKGKKDHSPVVRAGLARLAVLTLGGAGLGAMGFFLFTKFDITGIVSKVGTWTYLVFALVLMGMEMGTLNL